MKEGVFVSEIICEMGPTTEIIRERREERGKARNSEMNIRYKKCLEANE